jgi:hypothetical protein
MNKTVVFSFGRLNPPTIGHKVMVDALLREEKSRGAKAYLVLTTSHDPNKNPLSPDQKEDWVSKFFPSVEVVLATGNSIIKTAEQFISDGAEELVLVVGSDRVKEFSAMFARTELPVEVVSAGERDEGADGAKGASASKMRAAVAADDYEEFIALCPRDIGDEQMAEYFLDIKAGMGKTVEEKLSSIAIKEGAQFSIGDRVRTLMGDLLEVVDLRTNYVVGISESGDVQKWFLSQIHQTAELMEYRENTIKGIAISENIDKEFVSSLMEVDTYGVLKYLKAMNEGNEAEAEEQIEKLMEVATKQSQSAAIDLIAKSFNIKTSSTDPLKKLADLQKKSKVTPMRPEQKTMFNKMLNSLNGLGIPVELDQKSIK